MSIDYFKKYYLDGIEDNIEKNLNGYVSRWKNTKGDLVFIFSKKVDGEYIYSFCTYKDEDLVKERIKNKFKNLKEKEKFLMKLGYEECENLYLKTKSPCEVMLDIQLASSNENWFGELVPAKDIREMLSVALYPQNLSEMFE